MNELPELNVPPLIAKLSIVILLFAVTNVAPDSRLNLPFMPRVLPRVIVPVYPFFTSIVEIAPANNALTSELFVEVLSNTTGSVASGVPYGFQFVIVDQFPLPAQTILLNTQLIFLKLSVDFLAYIVPVTFLLS